VVYFKPAKDLAWPQASAVQAQVERMGGELQLHVQARSLARGVWIEFEGLDVDVADNALTLLPGESLRLKLKLSGNGKVTAADLQRALRLRVLGSAPL